MAESSTPPVVWVVSTGTEILQGHYTDRNAPWLSAQLLALGLPTARHMAIPDKADALSSGLGEAAREADLVITTGGLGPTGDDLNRQVIAELWGVRLDENAEALERIAERYRRRGRTMTDNNRVQALIPRGAEVLQNDHGTAPGFYLSRAAAPARAALLALPGPPREMQPMFNEQGAALLSADFGLGRARLRTLTFHTAGIPESAVDARVKDLYEADERVNFALLASLGHVQVRLTLMGANEAENDALAEEWRAKIHERIGAESIYGEDADTLEQVVGRRLRARGETIATAESCTGGLIAGRLTDIAGSSDYLREGFVTYSNEAKNARLGVSFDLLNTVGAVSAEVAEAMAAGARRAAASDWAVSVTGIAGPGGGSEDKPVGLVWFGIAGPKGSTFAKPQTARHVFNGNREEVRLQTVQMALELVRRAVSGYGIES